MIAKTTTVLLVNGLAVTNDGSVSSAWLDITAAVAATTRLQAAFLSVSQNDYPELIVEVADDHLGTNAAKVLRAAGHKTSPTETVLTHKHSRTDRFIRVTANNPGTTVGADLTLNAQVDLVTNIG